MENNTIAFPTIGKLVREIFNVTGLLAQKGKDNSFLLGSEKKKLQTQLKRLADESSKIDGKLEELLNSLGLLLDKALGEQRITFMILEAVEELLITYKNVLRDDGTYLNKKESTKWFIKQHVLDRVLLSSYKNYLKFNVPALKLNLPDLRKWALPDINEQKVNWPLRKAWQLIYDDLAISQSSFHCPNKMQEDYRATQNLENAQHWSTTNQIPSISSLFDNLEYSLSLLESPPNEALRRVVSKSKKLRFKIILFIGRASSYCFRELDNNFGREFLISCIKHINGQAGRLSRTHLEINTTIESLKSSTSSMSEDETNQLYYYATSEYWKYYAISIEQGTLSLQEYMNHESYQSLTKLEKVKLTIALVGSFTGHKVLAMTGDLNKSPSGFPELLCEGLELKKNPTSLNSIDNYKTKLKQAGLEYVLSWLANWCYANYFYTQKSFEQSYIYYERAFNKAKYCAGKNQYLLVNQYIESCAKNGKFKEMKKAVAWANYLGIEIRWLRGWDEPEAKATLTGLFKLIGNHKLQYTQL